MNAAAEIPNGQMAANAKFSRISNIHMYLLCQLGVSGLMKTTAFWWL
jgi:hypothetical protein